MKMKIMPKTLQGRRALFFSFFFVTSGGASTVVSSITDNKIEYPNPLNSPLLGTLIYLTFILAFITFFHTAKALLKYKDRAVLLYLIAVVSGWFSFTGIAPESPYRACRLQSWDEWRLRGKTYCSLNLILIQCVYEPNI